MTEHEMVEFRSHWGSLDAALTPLKPQGKHTGSHSGEHAVKVDGPPDFVDGVLTLLKPLLDSHDAIGPQGFQQRLHVSTSTPGKPITQKDGSTRDATNPEAGDNLSVRVWLTEKVPGTSASRPNTFDEGQPTNAAVAEARDMSDDEFAAGIEALKAARAA